MDMPPMDAAVAMDTTMEVGFFRHMMPTSCWKSMRWLNIGLERKLDAAHMLLRVFVLEMMGRRKINTSIGLETTKSSWFSVSSFLNNKIPSKIWR